MELGIPSRPKSDGGFRRPLAPGCEFVSQLTPILLMILAGEGGSMMARGSGTVTTVVSTRARARAATDTRMWRGDAAGSRCSHGRDGGWA